MKKWILIPLSLLAFTAFHSCNPDNLDVQPIAITEDVFFSTEQEFDQAVLATYQKLLFFYNYRGGGYIHGIWLLPDDDATTQGGSPFEIFSGIQATDGGVNFFFTNLYQLIQRANVVLLKQEQRGDVAYKNTTLRNTHRGEALFLRGYANYLLWNYFGTAPLVTERIVDIDDAYLTNTSGTQLLDQAIADFKAAAPLLPVAWDDANLGRVTANSALGMAGKALIIRASATNSNADYSEALGLLNQISNRALVADFGDNFDEKKENNDESLFEIQLGLNVSNNVWLNNDAFAVVGDLGGFYGFFDNHWSLFGAPVYTATPGLQSLYEPGDPRIDQTFSGNSIKKYVSRPRGSGNPDYWNNARVLRYADVLLLKAEALIATNGSVSEAINLVNQVRTRARNMGTTGAPADRDVNATDRNQVMQWIMDERRMELAFEDGARWIDLRRMHLGGKIDLNTWDFGSVRTDFDFEEKNLYLPIPSSELELNTNLRQNDGF